MPNLLDTMHNRYTALPLPVKKVAESLLARLPLERLVHALPAAQRLIDREYDKLLAGMEDSVKPYRGRVPSYASLPKESTPHADILAMMTPLAAQEQEVWSQGFVSGAVYHGKADHIALLNEVYGLYSQANPLHSDLWPSINKFEAEIISMTAHMLGSRSPAAANDEVCGCVSSGGTESILLAMKAYRDWARQEKGIRRPELIVPVTAHAAFDKACQYFKIKKVTIPVDKNWQACLKALRRAVTRNTIAIVGSAPNFPHGIIDPIAAMAAIAQQHGVGFHTDACLGGFVLPWVPEHYEVPAFDFRLPGVTSVSVDTHKFGFASKGSSVILYRKPELRRYQYYAITEWPGGLYFSPTFAGSRAGAISAQCWAALLAMGEEGYRTATAKILATADTIKEGIKSIPQLEILGDPLWVIAFAGKGIDIYQVMDFMAARHWSLNGLHRPSCLHLCVTLPHTEPGVAERFLGDLNEAVAHVLAHPVAAGGGMAPVYGMGASLPARGMVADLLKRYLDQLYKV